MSRIAPVRRLLAGMLAVIGAAWALPAAAQTQFTVGSTNLRTGPGTNFPIVATIPGGAAVNVGRCNNGWCGAAWRSFSGFVASSRLGWGGGGVPIVAVPPASFRVGFHAGFPYYFYGNRWYHRGRWYSSRPAWARGNVNVNVNVNNRNRNANRNRGNASRNANRNRGNNANRNNANRNRGSNANRGNNANRNRGGNANRNRGNSNRGGGGNQRRRPQRTEIMPGLNPLLPGAGQQVLVYAHDVGRVRELHIFSWVANEAA
jgi:uncharacterized protein YraI